MHRIQLETLQRWFNGTRRKPLIIRGARQVGKSTLIELFARQQNLNLLNVNLERYPGLAPYSFWMRSRLFPLPSLPCVIFLKTAPHWQLPERDHCWSLSCLTTTSPCRWGVSSICTWGR